MFYQRKCRAKGLTLGKPHSSPFFNSSCLRPKSYQVDHFQSLSCDVLKLHRGGGDWVLGGILFTDIVSVRCILFTDTVSVRYILFTGTVSARCILLTGTVSMNNLFHFGMLYKPKLDIFFTILQDYVLHFKEQEKFNFQLSRRFCYHEVATRDIWQMMRIGQRKYNVHIYQNLENVFVIEGEEEHVSRDNVYIWCVSKLGNIFRSPMWKKDFLRRPVR